MKLTKKILLLLAVGVFTLNANAAFVVETKAATTEQTVSTAPNAGNANLAPLVSSPKKLNKLQKFALKVMAKHSAGGDAKIEKGLYIVLAILGLGWVAMGVNDDFKGSDWIISLVLYFLFYFPGLIYSLVKMKKYYS